MGVLVVAAIVATGIGAMVVRRLTSPGATPVPDRPAARGSLPTRDPAAPSRPSAKPEPAPTRNATLPAGSTPAPQATAPDPVRAEARVLKARAYLARGKKRSAERLLKQAVRLDPFNPKRYAELALLEVDLHQDRPARKHLQIAIALSKGGRVPTDPQARLRALTNILNGL